jgi:hypothetical protein
MATLSDLIECMCAFAELNERELTKDFCTRFETYLRKQFPGEKVYVPAPDTSKKAQISEAARFLPTRVVAERYGVTTAWVSRVVKSGRGIK